MRSNTIIYYILQFLWQPGTQIGIGTTNPTVAWDVVWSIRASISMITPTIWPNVTQQHILSAVASDTITLNAAIQILTNKTLIDSSTIIADITDNTKQIKFDVSWTTSTSTTILSSQTVNRILTLPNATDTLVWKATTDIFTNKTLIDNSTIISDVSDNTKQIKFDAAGTTWTSTTILWSQTTNKTLTLPDITDTFVTKNTTDILTNKSISSTTNTVDANLFKTRAFDITTTKGDIWVDDWTQIRRLPLGTQDQKLVVDTAVSIWVKWQDSGTITWQVVFSSPISPTALTWNTNNYNPTGLSTSNILRLSSTWNYNLTWLQAPSPAVWQVLLVRNVNTSPNSITLLSNDTNSTATNRFLMNGSKNLQPNESLILVYDIIDTRWVVISENL